MGAEQHVPVIYLHAAVPGDPRYFLDVVHHTVSGVRAIGQAVAKGLLSALPAPRVLDRAARAEPAAPTR